MYAIPIECPKRFVKNASKSIHGFTTKEQFEVS